MQTYIFSQDSSPKKLGVRRQMPQASLPSLNVAVSAPAYTPLTPTTPGSGIMPSITRENLAARLRQNWLAQNPVEQPLPVAPAAADDSLTSLSWLQNLNIMKMASPTPPASPQPAAEATTSAANTNPSLNVNPNAVLNMDYCTAPIRVKQEPGMQANVTVSPPRVKSFSHDLLPSSPTPGVDTIDYKTDARVKPHHSYADLIAMAMENSGKKKITLAGIYSYITENFLWYKNADISWQNSIRHNLSLNKSFLKVPRKKEEPGKGGFWKMNPECEHQFKNSSCKKRRGGAILRDVPPPTPSSSLKRQHSIDTSDSDSNLPDLPPAKRVCVKREPSASIPSLDSLNGDYTWNSLLSQDITVGDQKVKTEAIIDGDADIASSITEMSPPPSEGSNTDEIFDLLSTGFSEPLDFTTGQPLDLSINGTSVSKPNWWDDSLTTAHFRDAEDACGLHTPVHEPDTTPHPWAESDKDELDSALACFDPCFDTSLFTVDNLSSQHDL